MSENRETHMGPLLGYCAQLCRQRLDRGLSTCGVTQAQARILLHLLRMEEKREEVNQKDLERSFCIRASTVNGLVERLEEKGLITRAAGSRDGRCRVLLITEKGRSLHREMRRQLLETEEVMLAGFSTEEKTMMQNFLERMIVHLKDEGEGTPCAEY